MEHAKLAALIEGAATAAQMDEAARLLYGSWGEGRVTDDDAARLERSIVAKRTAMRERTAPASEPRAQQVGRLVASIFPTRVHQRSPNRSTSIERRRRLAASGPLPPQLAARFTTGQQAVLKIVGDHVARQGFCALPIDAIAALAGCCRRLAQGAIRLAERDGLLIVTERRVKGRKNETNVIRIIVREWLAWLKRGPRVAPMAAPGASALSLKAVASEGTGCRNFRPTRYVGSNPSPSMQGRTVVGLPEGSGRAERWFSGENPRAG